MPVFREPMRFPLPSSLRFPAQIPPITAHIHAHQPPINALALPDFSKVLIFAKTLKDYSVPGQPVPGIFKRDWVSKHRTKIPAVVAALFSSDHVFGDPAQWLQVCTDLDNLKEVIKAWEH